MLVQHAILTTQGLMEHIVLFHGGAHVAMNSCRLSGQSGTVPAFFFTAVHRKVAHLDEVLEVSKLQATVRDCLLLGFFFFFTWVGSVHTVVPCNI